MLATIRVGLYNVPIMTEYNIMYKLWAIASLPAIAQLQGSLCLFFCQLWADLLQVLDLLHHNQLQHVALEESKALQMTGCGGKCGDKRAGKML